MTEDDEIVREFLLESAENLDQLDRDLVELEKQPSSKDILSSIFRAVHTIKGATGFFGFTKLESLTHSGEGLLDRLRDGQLTMSPEIAGTLLEMVDAAREILRAIESTGGEGQTEYAPVAEKLGKLQHSQACAEVPPPGTPSPKQAAGPPPSPDAPLPLGQILVQSGHVSEAQLQAALAAQSGGDPRYLGEILVEQGVVPFHVIRAAIEEQKKGRSSALAANAIRVPVDQLETLMSLVRQLGLARDAMVQSSATPQHAFLQSFSRRFDSITTKLEACVMKLRMQPIDDAWNKVPRMVRDLAASCGKQVRVEMEGHDVALDRAVVEAIRDPLTHIVRNAVDHGIELPGQRIRAGKPAEGLIFLRARQEGSHVSLEISDDGVGVDLSRVRQKAVERGLVTPEQAALMNEQELLNLIFLPGLSTAREITRVSGRGVGMDVVRANIDRIGGTVEATSKAAEGLTLRIKLPLAPAIVPAVILSCTGECFAIPEASLIEVIYEQGDEASETVKAARQAAFWHFQGGPLPLVWLSRELDRSAAPEDAAPKMDSLKIAVLQAGSSQFGLVVDEVEGREEIVARPLGEELRKLSVYTGSTVTKTGKIALILDVPALAKRAYATCEHAR